MQNSLPEGCLDPRKLEGLRKPRGLTNPQKTAHSVKGPSQETKDVKQAELETPDPKHLAKPQGFHEHSFPVCI